LQLNQTRLLQHDDTSTKGDGFEDCRPRQTVCSAQVDLKLTAYFNNNNNNLMGHQFILVNNY
jgi:hypothetical protein